ncbi:DNA-binding protein [Salmonella enterica]|uniref:DNA-binding protein n=1 Tax=Salmonella enterica I TaxID=59201 RepID=A0A3R1AJR3_SALET|nr:DNA-binding protein [Salmonella enterica subsp. enterica serovar Kokomlemle]EEB7409774.1 DNA-binding protein [Salmonella enterica]EGJ5834699.1 DNA-binding protein [Salmonella enterica]MML55216.1 DNA-binding protein [Salmonella enterica subsp. enterica serovar Kidderminster]
MKQLKTTSEVRADFERHGITISSWARLHNLPRQIVHDVLHGRCKGRRGMSHKAAVLLGLKDGVINEE